jgi:iron(III) transport system permease protein
MVPGIIIVIAYLQLYGDSGIITSLICYFLKLEDAPYSFRGYTGILFVHALTQYVHFYLQTYIALKYIDYSEIEVARGMGASKARIFIDVIFPTIRPAIVLSIMMTFISGISSYAAPSILGQGYKVLSTQIATSKANYDFQRAALAAVVLFVIGFFVLICSQYNNRKSKIKRNLRATQFIQKNRMKLTVGRVVEHSLVFVLLLLIILPIIAIVYLSFIDNQSILTELIPNDFTFSNYIEIFKSKRTLDSFSNSINMSIFVVVVGFLFTVPLSYMVSKKKTFINNLAWFLVTLSWSIPASVLAVNLITAFNQRNIFAFGQILIGGYYILPIAYTIHTLPLMMNNNMIAMDNFNPVFEDASRGLGAGRMETFRRIVLPSVLPGIISGSMLAIINTLGEYTISNLLYGVHNTPISVAMLKRFTNYYFGEAMAYAAVVILLCCLLFAIVFKLDKKSYF